MNYKEDDYNIVVYKELRHQELLGKDLDIS